MARPSKYNKKYVQMIIDFFNRPAIETTYERSYYADGKLKSERPIVLPAEFPTFQGFARLIGVHVDTLIEWKKLHEEFSEAYMKAKQIQEDIWLINGMSGRYNPQFAKFFGINCLDYKDKTEVETFNHDLDIDLSDFEGD